MKNIFYQNQLLPFKKMKAMMLALGTNLGDKAANLRRAAANIELHFKIKAISRIYKSTPIGVLDQPDFYNLVLSCDLPSLSPFKCLEILQQIESDMGRKKIILQGARIIDIDILFFDAIKVQTKMLTLPHPQWHLRSFTVYPMMELSAYNKIKFNYTTQNLPQRKGLMPVGYL